MFDDIPAVVAANLLSEDKVYVVWYDNNELHEDSFSEIDAIFKTVEEAEKYVEKMGYTRKEPYGFHIDHGNYRIVDDSRYHISSKEDAWWSDSTLEIREYSLRTDNMVYNEKKESEYKPSEADTE